MRQAAAALLTILLVTPSLAQEKLVETIEVRVVNVDVVVRDHAGNPVTGLTKDDFEIFDNGKPQPITNLYEIRPETGAPATATPGQPATTTAASASEAPSELRQRKLIVFIDNYSLPPLRRNQVFIALQKFIEAQMRPTDETMVVVWNQGLKIVNQFTSDKNVIRQSIATVNDFSNGGGFTNQQQVDQIKRRANELVDVAKEGKMSWQDAYSMATSGIDSYAEQTTHSSTRILDALAKTTGALAGVEGKKVLVFAGAHLPERPGAELYTYMYNLFLPYMRMLNFNMEGITGRSGKTHYSIEETAKQASANGVTLYMIDAADSRDSTSAERPGDANRGLDDTEAFQAFANTAMAYQTLARITGGVAITNSENFDATFASIARDFNSYYSLGYKPTDDETGGQRKLVVKMKNPQYRARTRETYAPKSTEDQMSDRVIANIYNELKGDWKISIITGPPQKDGGRFKIPVLVSLAPTITLLPKDDQLVGAFTLFIAVGNGSGGRSTVTRSPQSLKIPPAAEKQLRSRPMTFNALILMNPGENTLSVGILDQVSNSTGFARAKVMAE